MNPKFALWLAHNWERFLGVILVGVIVVGGPFFSYRYGNNTGYKSGYAQSLKDNPPNVYTGQTTVNQQPVVNCSVYGVQVGKVGLGLVLRK